MARGVESNEGSLIDRSMRYSRRCNILRVERRAPRTPIIDARIMRTLRQSDAQSCLSLQTANRKPWREVFMTNMTHALHLGEKDVPLKLNDCVSAFDILWTVLWNWLCMVQLPRLQTSQPHPRIHNALRRPTLFATKLCHLSTVRLFMQLSPRFTVSSHAQMTSCWLWDDDVTNNWAFCPVAVHAVVIMKSPVTPKLWC